VGGGGLLVAARAVVSDTRQHAEREAGVLELRDGGPAIWSGVRRVTSRGLATQRAAHPRGVSVLPRHPPRVLGRLSGHEQRGLLGAHRGLVSWQPVPRAYNSQAACL